jgi:hypothetical protein
MVTYPIVDSFFIIDTTHVRPNDGRSTTLHWIFSTPLENEIQKEIRLPIGEQFAPRRGSHGGPVAWVNKAHSWVYGFGRARIVREL